MNSDPILCDSCGAVLDPQAPGGLCPRCLMAHAMQPTEPSLEAAREPPPSIETVQASFPQLEILEFVGQGGMGWVFKARQTKLNRFVALKLLPSSLAERDASFAGRFEREGQLLARLHHPNIVAVHDSGAAGGFFYLLMEYVEGVNLRQAMRSSRFTPSQALAIVPHICDALQFAHDEGVLHRDIKPENILLNGKGRVKLADFGIAKLIGENGTVISPLNAGTPAGTPAPLSGLTQSGATLGTPSYMAPEQLDTPADVDHRADIYSLGVVFYELLTGELPTGSFAPPSAKSAADPRVDAIVQQALEKERTRRQSSAGELKTQVETLAASGDAASAKVQELKPEDDLRVFRKSIRSGIAVGSSCVLLVIVGFMAFLNRAGPTHPTSYRASPASPRNSGDLAESSVALQKLPTAEVIQAGLSKPLLPWAWLALQFRPLTAGEAGQILDGLTGWLQREHPAGFSGQMVGLEPLLKELTKRGLTSDERSIRFLDALDGRIRCEPLLRQREGAKTLLLQATCRNRWIQAPLGLVMMNEMRAVTVDGQSIELASGFRYWNSADLFASLPMRALAPGKHTVKLEVLSALVPEGDLTGLASNAPSTDWPPAKKTWTRTAETEVVIYPRDAVIVSQTQDPALDPAASGDLSVKQVIIRSKGSQAQVLLIFNMNDNLPVPISFDVTLRVGDQSIRCGKLWASKRWNPDGQIDSRSGQEVTTALAPLSPEIMEAGIILTPNPQYVEHIATVDRIWGKEIVFSSMPLTRQDLTKPTAPDGTVTKTTPAATPSSTTPALMVELWVAEVPADFFATAESMAIERLRETKDVDVIAAPRVTFFSGQETDVGAARDAAENPAGAVLLPPTGFSFRLRATLESGRVLYHLDATNVGRDESVPPANSTIKKTSIETLELDGDAIPGIVSFYQTSTTHAGRPVIVALRYKLVNYANSGYETQAAALTQPRPIPPEAVALMATMKALRDSPAYAGTGKLYELGKELSARGKELTEMLRGTEAWPLVEQLLQQDQVWRKAMADKDQAAIDGAKAQMDTLRHQLEQQLQRAARPATPIFGPVIERTMKLLDPANSAMHEVTLLDLATGREALTPNGNLDDRRGNMIAEAELLRDQAKVASVRFSGLGMTFRKIPNGQWDARDPSEVTGDVEKWKWDDLFNPPSPMPDPAAWAKDEATLPADFAFYTREGGFGLLQLLSFDAENRMAKVRYKLAEFPPERGKAMDEAAVLQTKLEQSLQKGVSENAPENVKLRARITALEQIADLQAHLTHLFHIGFAERHPKILELRARIAAIERAGEATEPNTQGPAPPGASPSAPSFGPVMARVITEDDTDSQGTLLFRLETGTGFQPDFPISRKMGGKPFAEMTPQLRKQADAMKTDMLLRMSNRDFEWMTLDMQEIFAGAANDWDKITPEKLMALLASRDAKDLLQNGKPTGYSYGGYNTGEAECTAFRTRGNLIGVFQLKGYPDQTHPGVMLRYKLVLHPELPIEIAPFQSAAGPQHQPLQPTKPINQNTNTK